MGLRVSGVINFFAVSFAPKIKSADGFQFCHQAMLEGAGDKPQRGDLQTQQQRIPDEVILRGHVQPWRGAQAAVGSQISLQARITFSKRGKLGCRLKA